MLVLGIETSGRGGSLALSRDGVVLVEHELPATGRRHARMLVSDLQALLREQEIAARELEAISVSVGPGSFTGLRVGIVCAKTLAYGLGRPLAAVDTFLAVAARVPAEVQQLAVFDDALRGEIFVGRYARAPHGWNITRTPVLAPADDWLEQNSNCPGLVVTGPGLKKWNETFRERVPLLSEDLWMPRAGAVALLGEEQLKQGLQINPTQLEPFYIRRSTAEEQAERAAAIAATNEDP